MCNVYDIAIFVMMLVLKRPFSSFSSQKLHGNNLLLLILNRTESPVRQKKMFHILTASPYQPTDGKVFLKRVCDNSTFNYILIEFNWMKLELGKGTELKWARIPILELLKNWIMLWKQLESRAILFLLILMCSLTHTGVDIFAISYCGERAIGGKGRSGTKEARERERKRNK